MKYHTGIQTHNQDNWLNLHLNENLFADSSIMKGIVMEAVEQTDIRKYPDPDCQELKQRLAQLHGVLVENIFVGNGADDVIESLMFVLRQKYAEIIVPRIHFKMYDDFAKKYDYRLCEFENLPMLQPVIAASSISIRGMFLIDSPCSLTGQEFDDTLLRTLTDIPDNFVIWDNCHGDYTGTIHIPVQENMVVIRHFKYFYALASLRLGYCVGPAHVISQMQALRQPFAVNAIAQTVAIICMDKQDYFESVMAEARECKEIFTQSLQKLGFEYSNSAANFTLIKHPDVPSDAVHRELAKQHIATRHYADDPLLQDYLRVAVPPRAELRRVISNLENIVQTYSY